MGPFEMPNSTILPLFLLSLLQEGIMKIGLQHMRMASPMLLRLGSGTLGLEEFVQQDSDHHLLGKQGVD